MNIGDRHKILGDKTVSFMFLFFVKKIMIKCLDVRYKIARCKNL